MLLEFGHIQRPYFLHQAVDDFNAGQIAFMGGAVKALAGKGFLMQCAVGIAVKKAAQFILEFLDPFNRGLAQAPGKILPRQPFPADDGIHEMALH